MNNEKMENLLNLALDATERELEKSLELDVGYDRAERTWEVIVKYGGTTEELKALLRENFPDRYEELRFTNLSNEYAILTLPASVVTDVASLPEIEYMENQKTDFWSDLEEEGRERIGVSEEEIGRTFSQMAYAQKQQKLLSEEEGVDYREYNVNGSEYEALLQKHTYQVNEKLWKRLNFGKIIYD